MFHFGVLRRFKRGWTTMAGVDVEELILAWRANNAVNLELLRACDEESMDLKPGRGKTVRSNFVHIVGVRRGWLEARAPAAAGSVPKLDWKTASREDVESGLRTSSNGMEVLFRKSAASARAAKWTPLMFFAYCVAHEAHHRSQIEVALRLGGKEPDDRFLYSLWEWPSLLAQQGAP